MPIAAVASLGIVGDAIVALLVILCILAIAYLVQKFGSYIPLIGGWLAAQATRFLQAAATVNQYIYDNMLHGLHSVVQTVNTVIQYPFTRVYDTVYWIMILGVWLKTVAIPRALNAAYGYAYWIWNDARGLAYDLFNAARAEIASAIATAEAYAYWTWVDARTLAQSLYSQGLAYTAQVLNYAVAAIANLRAETQSLIVAALSTALADIARVESGLTGLIGSVASTLEADILHAEQELTSLIERYAEAALHEALTEVDSIAAVALTDIWPHLVTDVDALLDAIPKALTDIRDDIAAIPRIIPGNLADALTALGVLAIPFLRFLRECGVPMCSNLHGLSDLFNDLNSLGTDAAMLGLFVLAAHNPHQAADAITSVIGPLAHGAATVTKDLIGV